MTVLFGSPGQPPGGTFLQAHRNPGWADQETTFKNTLSGGNCMVFRNTAADGYSAIVYIDDQNWDRFAQGYGNSQSTPFFAGRSFTETHNGNQGAGVLPKEHIFAVDGNYGRTGTPGNFNFIQRYTANDRETVWWKGIAYVDGSEQVKGGGFTESGAPFVALNTEPPAAEIAKGYGVWWLDSTAGTVVLNMKAKDVNGKLYKTSWAVNTAITSNADDNFTGADSATSLNGRVASGVGTWAVFNNNWGISSNKGYRSSGTNDDYAYIDTGKSDVEVTCDITLSAVRAAAGLVVRGVDANNYTYVQFSKCPAGTNQILVFKKVSGSFFQIGPTFSYTLTLGSTYTLRVGAVGNSIYIYVNDVFIGRVEDNTQVSATKQGLFSYLATQNDDGGTRYDNFKVYV